MDTKSRILQTATELFNISGTAMVSTNHVAAAADISPGNLYYHYPNKEAIIRAIADQMIARWGAIWAQALVAEPSLNNLQASLRQNFGVLWDYRFFFRELIPLLTHDPALKQRYQTVRRQRFAEFEALFQRYIGAGVLRLPGSASDLQSLFRICMLINNQWLVEVAIEGDPVTSEQIDDGVSLIMYLWRPYLSGTPSLTEA